MNILVLGDKGYSQRSHFCENIALEFSKLGHEVSFIGVEDIQKVLTEKRFALHRYNKMPFRLSRFEPERDNIDLIFHDQCDMEFLNNVKTPVFYNHKYVHRKFSCFYPDVAFFLTDGLMEYCNKVDSSYECYLTKYKYVMPSATEIDTYHPKEKIYKGISWFGSRNSTEENIDDIELLVIAQRTLYRWEERLLRKWSTKGKLQINMFETPIPTLKYRELLPKCEAIFMSIPRGQFVSRMMFEAMACKTLFICEIQSERHEQTLKDLGFINGEHYIGLNKLKDILCIEELFTEEMIQEIIENAYNVVIENHLYKNRAEQIIEVYNKLYGKENEDI